MNENYLTKIGKTIALSLLGLSIMYALPNFLSNRAPEEIQRQTRLMAENVLNNTRTQCYYITQKLGIEGEEKTCIRLKLDEKATSRLYHKQVRQQLEEYLKDIQ